ncbi:MAG: 5-formyltetrahydrofolate cyclo-ligase [Planctomycetota bacterium]
MTTGDDKRALRNEIKLALARLGPAEVAARSVVASGYLVDRWRSPGAAMGYLALPLEADPMAAMAAWGARGARVCVPRADWVSRSMEPAVLGGRLITGPHGVRSVSSEQPAVGIDTLEVVVVPGLGFTACGARLGRGGGFYDRFLARLGPGTVAVGLAVSAQMCDDVPTEPTDRRVDWVVTEDGAVDCRPDGRGSA